MPCSRKGRRDAGEGSDRRESVAEGGDKEVRVGHRGANTKAKPRGLGVIHWPLQRLRQ